MSFATTMTALKDKVDGLIANRVAKFAYTQQAYNSDDVNGVTEYNYSAEQNVPTSSASVLKVNETVLTKGWRTQASAITRMLMNHFLGRTSYNLNKTVDFLKDFMLAIENNMGVADGFATLDTNAHLPLAQLTPDVIIDCGEWDADTNTPELEIGEGRKGDTYRVSVAGTQDLGEGNITYRVGDTIMYNGSIWVKTASGTVSSVNTVTPDDTGNVTITGEDINMSSSDLISIKDKINNVLKLSFTPLLGRVWQTCIPEGNISIKISNYTKNQIVYWKGVFYTHLTESQTSSYLHGFYKSSDGLNWDSISSNWLDGDDDPIVTSITFLENIYNPGTTRVIIGTHSNGLYYSDDLFRTIESTNITTGTFYDNAINYLTTAVIIGDDKALRSLNLGETWQVVKSDSNFNTGFGGVTMAKNNHSLLCTTNLVKSTDLGATWTVPSPFVVRYAPVYFKEKNMYLCWGGSSSNGISYSVNDLVSFNECVNGTANVKSMAVRDVVYGSCFVAGTNANGLIYSVDGITWHKSNITSGQYIRVFYANGMFIAILYGTGQFKYSQDGITWSPCVMSNHAYVDPIYGNGVWIAFDTTDKCFIFSTDGMHWYATDRTYSANYFYPCHVHGIFFASSSANGFVASSVDTLIERGWVNID